MDKFSNNSQLSFDPPNISTLLNKIKIKIIPSCQMLTRSFVVVEQAKDVYDYEFYFCFLFSRLLGV